MCRFYLSYAMHKSVSHSLCASLQSSYNFGFDPVEYLRRGPIHDGVLIYISNMQADDMRLLLACSSKLSAPRLHRCTDWLLSPEFCVIASINYASLKLFGFQQADISRSLGTNTSFTLGARKEQDLYNKGGKSMRKSTILH